MGHPKFHRKCYARPKKPFYKARIDKEKAILQSFGLRRKHEIWRAEGILRDYRRRARELLARPNAVLEKELIAKVDNLGLKCSSLDDVLGVSLEDFLGRRLQTIVYKKGISSTARQARQYIVHGHINVDNRRVRWPSFLVTVDLEDKIAKC